jgi:hypothetical protein
MLDHQNELVLARQQNINRYRRLLTTYLTGVERRFVERRLVEERAALVRLTRTAARAASSTDHAASSTDHIVHGE